MRSHAAPSREDPLRRLHSTDIVGTRLNTTQYNPLAAPFPLDRVLGMKNDATSGCSWTRFQTFREQQCFLFTDNAFADHVNGNTYGGEPRALARARLKHPKLAVLDGKLNVLHVCVMFLEKPADPL